MNRHPLTDKIGDLVQNKPRFGFGDIDSIIREYLEGCAKEICDKGLPLLASIRPMLGLSPKPELNFCKYCNANPCDCQPATPTEQNSLCDKPTGTLGKYQPMPHPIQPGSSATPTDKNEWCEHLYKANSTIWLMRGSASFNTSDWNLCPICAKPRPEKKSEAQALMDHLNSKHNCSISIRVAESAVEFLTKNKEGE